MVLSAPSHDTLAHKCAKLLFLASERLGLFSKIYLELVPASPGAQSQVLFPTQLGQIRLQPSIGSEKNVFSDPIPDRNRI